MVGICKLRLELCSSGSINSKLSISQKMFSFMCMIRFHDGIVNNSEVKLILDCEVILSFPYVTFV